jgi:hypothetical protein
LIVDEPFLFLSKEEQSCLTRRIELVKFLSYAEVAKQADALRSGRSGHYARVGSNPTFGNELKNLDEILSGFFVATGYLATNH